MNIFKSRYRHLRIRTAIIVLLAISSAALVGCAKEYTGFDESALPKAAADEEVLAKWDGYPILKTVPRYAGGGLFDIIAEPSGEAVNVYYNGTSQSDFEYYNALLKQSGFKLKEGSDIWTSEGSLGVPQYVKGEIQVTLVWSIDGTLAICVAYS